MTETTSPDLFHDKAADWDTRPIPVQISTGVVDAIRTHVPLSEDLTVMDFGAGTGLLCTKIAPRVGHLLAVDISRSMLDQLAQKPELQGRAEVFCQDILTTPLDRKVDLVISAMAMHHVEDTAALMRTLHDHLVPGGRVALADLDKEDGSFHPPGIEGVYHDGFDQQALGAVMEEAGFVDVTFVPATTVDKDGRHYPIFLVTARRAD